jgi:hypothetical protein
MNETIKATLTADGSQFQREFERSGKTVDGLQKSLLTAGKAIGSFFAARAIVSGIRGMITDMDELGKTATRLRLPVGDVQALGLAAKTGGTDITTLVRALERAQVAATEAGRGTATYAREFEQLKINIAEFQGLNHEGRLRVLADSYANAADKGEAFTALTRIMGRSVGDLLPLLDKGGDAIDELGRSITRLNDADVRAIEEMNDQIEAMSQTVRTSLMQGLLALRPQLEWFTATLRDGAVGIRNMLDPAGGTGLKGDLFDVLETLREIDSMGGVASERTDARFQALAGRFEGMNDELKIMARQILDSEQIARDLASGRLTESEAEQHVQIVNRIADEARAALAIEQDRQSVAAATTEHLEEQAAAAEKIAESEAKADAALQKRLAGMAPLREQLKAILEEGRQIFDDQGSTTENFNFLRRKLEGTTDPAQRLELIQSMERLLDLRDQALKIEQEITREQETAAQAATRAAEEAAAAKERELRAAQDAARLQDQQNRSAAAFAAETQALQLELAGRKDLADALREESRMREDSLRLAERLGVSEAQALNLLREQANLRRQIAAQDGRQAADSSRPRTPRFGASGVQGATGLGGSRPLLRDATLDRRDLERRMTPRDPAAEAAKYWEQQIDLQEKLLQTFQRLGAI